LEAINMYRASRCFPFRDVNHRQIIEDKRAEAWTQIEPRKSPSATNCGPVYAGCVRISTGWLPANSMHRNGKSKWCRYLPASSTRNSTFVPPVQVTEVRS